MSTTRLARTLLVCLSALFSLLVGSLGLAQAEPVWGLSLSGRLFTFDTTSPGTVQIWPGPVGGLTLANERLYSPAVRPRTGALYALAGNTTDNLPRLYRIDTSRNIAIQIGAPLTLPDAYAGTMTFDPVLDRIRVTGPGKPGTPAEGQTFQWLLHPETAAIEFSGTIAHSNLVRLAHTNRAHGADRSTLFALTNSPHSLLRVGGVDLPDNSASQNAGLTTLLLPILSNGSHVSGFDVSADGTGYGVSGFPDHAFGSNFSRFDLTTGVETRVGGIGVGTLREYVSTLALVGRPTTVYGVNTNNELVAFRGAMPSVLLTPTGSGGGTPRPITGLADAGEQILTLDMRPLTGVIYAVSDRARLYTLDPATAAATLIAPISPAPAGSTFSIDVDPSSDRIRLSSDLGQQFVIHPDTAQVEAIVSNPDGLVVPAFTSNVRDAASTVLYGIQPFDGTRPAELVTLYRSGDILPQRVVLPFASVSTGLDVAPGSGIMLASLTAPGDAGSYLYYVTEGRAARVGSAPIGGGAPIRDITAAAIGYLQFSAPAYEATEGGGVAVRVQVTRVAGSDGPLGARVELGSYDGAFPGTDYTPVVAGVEFADGESDPIDVTIAELIDNATPNPDRIFLATLTATIPGTSFGRGTPSPNNPHSTLIVIKDDDAGAQATTPSVSITSPTAGPSWVTTAESVILSGTAVDPNGIIVSMRWSANNGGGASIPVTSPASSVSWTTNTVGLSPGVNRIKVFATDNAGHESFDTLIVSRPPVASAGGILRIQWPSARDTVEWTESEIFLEGIVQLPGGVAKIHWMSDRVPDTGVATGTSPWRAIAIPLLPGANRITVSALGTTGHAALDSIVINVTDPSLSGPPIIELFSPTTGAPYSTTAGEVHIDGLTRDPGGKVMTMAWSSDAYPTGGTLVLNDGQRAQTEWNARIPLAAGVNRITFTATDDQGNTGTKVVDVERIVPLPPAIAITGPTADPTWTTMAETVTIDGTASNGQGTVNTVSWRNDTAGTSGSIAIGGPAALVSWSTGVLPLAMGVNQFTITATFSDSSVLTDTITVTRTALPPAPTLAITSPTVDPTFITTAATVLLGGTATNGGGTVDSLSWMNETTSESGTFTFNPSASVNWFATLPIVLGENRFTITAVFSSGASLTDTITVTRAPTPQVAPTVTIASPTTGSEWPTTDSSVTLQGFAEDVGGSVASLRWTIDGGPANELWIEPAPLLPWAVVVPVPLGTHTITVTATMACSRVPPR